MACWGTITPLLCTLMSFLMFALTQLGHTHGPHNGSPGGVPGRPPDPTISQKRPKSALHQGCACTTSLLKCTNWPCMPLPPNGPPLEKKSTYGVNQLPYTTAKLHLLLASTHQLSLTKLLNCTHPKYRGCPNIRNSQQPTLEIQWAEHQKNKKHLAHQIHNCE